MMTSSWKSAPNKLHIYESLCALNRGFEITLLSLERLGLMGVFRAEYLNAFRVSLERTRAEANEELMQTIQENEEHDSAYFDRLQRDWEKQLKDPDDVFIAARERRQKIKEEIRALQRSLRRHGKSGR